VHGEGNIIITDYYNHRVWKITPDGTVSTLPGSEIARYNTKNNTQHVPIRQNTEEKGRGKEFDKFIIRGKTRVIENRIYRGRFSFSVPMFQRVSSLQEPPKKTRMTPKCRARKCKKLTAQITILTQQEHYVVVRKRKLEAPWRDTHNTDPGGKKERMDFLPACVCVGAHIRDIQDTSPRRVSPRAGMSV
jgi:hypothetical protein